MGWEVANRVGITMIGRSQGKHFLLFTGAERFRYSARTQSKEGLTA
jgi:FdhD protein